MDELYCLTEYGDRYYNMETRDEEFCERCFKELKKEFTTPRKASDD